MIITDIYGNTEMLTGYKKLQRKRKVNGDHSLSFDVFETDNNKHSFDLVEDESIIEYDNNTYRIKKFTHSSIGNRSFKKVNAQHTFFDLIDEYQYEIISGTLSIDECFTHALQGTGYIFEILDAFPTIPFEKFGDGTPISLIQTALSEFGAEFTVDGNIVTVKQQIGDYIDYQMRFKRNIKAISRVSSTNNLSTYIKGFGKDIETDYTSPLANIYGIKHASPFRDERYTNIDSLKNKLKESLQDEPELNIEVEFVELKKAGFEGESIDLGDTLYLIYEPLNNLDITARVIEYNEHPESPDNSTVVLSNYQNNIVNVMADFNDTKNKVDNILTQGGNVRYDVMDAYVKQATEALHNSMTELQYPANGGIIAVDKTDNNNIVVFNSAGIGVSTNGGKTFDNAITGQGIVAQRIIGKLLLGMNLIIENESGKYTLNENGFTIDGGSITITNGLPDNQIKSATKWNGQGVHIDENGIYTGNITWNQGQGGTLELGGQNNQNGVMEVYNSDGELIAILDGDQGGFDDLTITDLTVTENIEAPNIVKSSDEDVNYRIRGETGNDDLSGVNSWENALYSVREALSRIPKFYNGTANIDISTAEEVTENIVISGFTGRGTINLNIRGSKINGRIRILSNNLRVNILGDTGTVSYEEWADDIIYCESNQYVGIEQVVVNGNGQPFGIRGARGGSFYLYRNEIYNFQRCIEIERNTVGHCNDNFGLGELTGIRANAGGIATIRSRIPMGGNYDTYELDGGQIFGEGTPDSGSATPPAPPIVEVKQTWSANDGNNYSLDYNSWGSTNYNTPYQGRWDQWGPYKGCWFFGSGMRNTLNGKTIKRIRVKLNRASGSGNYSSVNAIIRMHQHASQPSGEPTMSNTTHSVGFKAGATKWFTLPSSFHSLFSNGSWYGLGIYHSSPSNSNYMRFTDMCEIEVTYEDVA